MHSFIASRQDNGRAGTVVALEAALALRLDPDCVPALADPAAVRTERTPPRLLGWLRRRRSA